MTYRAEPVFLEVVERTPAHNPDARGIGATIRPNEVRLNGQPLAVPAGESIVVHETKLGDDELVQVTLTLWVRGVRIAQEHADDTVRADG